MVSTEAWTSRGLPERVWEFDADTPFPFGLTGASYSFKDFVLEFDKTYADDNEYGMEPPASELGASASSPFIRSLTSLHWVCAGGVRYAFREQVFQSNLMEIMEHNSAGHSYRSVNTFHT